jgi:hypothetical protein
MAECPLLIHRNPFGQLPPHCYRMIGNWMFPDCF